MPPVFHLLIAAQCLSALADNALLIVAIALLQQAGMAAWWAPMLKVGFIASYVLLAPFVGPLADAVPKARLMAWMNGVKLAGVVGLALGLSPLAAFAVVGLGAAAYAPAKYGLATELVGPALLVRANGWIEVTAVSAVLFGTGLGGLLVSPPFLHATLAADAPLQVGVPSLMAVLALYVVSGLLNLGIRDSGVRRMACALRPMALLRDFAAANRLLWRDREGGLSLAVTTIFWGVGATLQFVVLRWANERMHLALDEAALVQAAVALGVILGAILAGLFVPLERARRMLVAGVLFGLLMTAVAFTDRLGSAVALLMIVGAVGGLVVVPLNALLQHRGYVLLSPGRSIAVQGANENASVLGFLAVYAGLVSLDVPLTALMMGLGCGVALALGLLIVREEARDRRDAEVGCGVRS